MPWKYPRVDLPPEEPSAIEIPESSPLDSVGSSQGQNLFEIEESSLTGSEPVWIASPDQFSEDAQSQTNQTPQTGGSSAIEQPQSIAANIPEERELTEEIAKEKPGLVLNIPWAAISALFLALFAQILLEPGPSRNALPGILFYILSFISLGLAIYRKEWILSPIPAGRSNLEPDVLRLPQLLIGLTLAVFTFLTSGDNHFNLFNLILAAISMILVMRAFWIPSTFWKAWRHRAGQVLRRKSWDIRITPEALLVGAALLLVLFFRLYRLDAIPAEMNSDHAEKILDVLRVLEGQTMIFFPTNGGREAIQMYLVASLNRIFSIPVDFFALKLASSLAGLLSLVFIYLLGMEIANRRVALFAMVFTGVAYWTNVVSRMGLRLPFYILFTAALLFFLLRGLKNNHRNDFLFAGICLGLSFYGYTADRILPFLVIAVIFLFLLRQNSTQTRRATLISTAGLFLVALVLLVPLLRFMFDYPESFLFRTLTRVGTIERPLEGPAILIFIKNLGKALMMFSWSNGEVWTLSVPFRPALDIVSGALYWIGLILVAVRAVRQKHWLDFSLLISIPILLLPSVMSLAFPVENPNLYRTGGVVVPAFLLVALALDGLVTSVERLGNLAGKIAAWALALLLLFGSSLHSYNLVFHQYDQQYRLSAWNSSEMGAVIRNFSGTVGTPDTSYVIGYPHWVDTRLVAMNAGIFPRDPNIPVDRLAETLADPRAKIFILKPEDELAIVTLNNLYPQGTITTYASRVPTKEFIIFFVPPAQ